MQVDQQELDKVEQKLKKQNGLKAAVAISFWSVLIFVAWYFVFQYQSQLAPMFLLISGALVGLAVRLHGKGYSVLFSFIAFVAHGLLVVSALLYNLLLAPGDSIWAIFLLALYVFGAWSAAYIGRMQIPFLEHKGFFLLTERNTHVSSKQLKNRWFIALPIVVLLGGSLLIFSMFSLLLIDETTALVEASETKQQSRETFNNKAIDVRPESLVNYSVNEALLHAYAFKTGQLPNEYGYIISRYPKSNFKAQTILKYLSETGNSPRAKFILGVLTSDTDGRLLIRDAANEGDDYAKLREALQFGCNGRPEVATDLLQRLKSTMRDEFIRKKIDAVFSFGFVDACEEMNANRFLLEYAINV